jgi:mono/diheme cytochrome c family protein
VKTLALAGMFVVGLVGGVFAEVGSDLFRAKCQSCHGPAGRGNPALKKVYGPNLDITGDSVQLRDDAELIKIVQNGAVRGKMPRFKGRLSEDQIAAVVAHLRTLKVATPGNDVDLSKD